MKVSRDVAAANRERVLQAAARLFRERGIDGVALTDVMREAGLTHGAFYGQFASKEALAAEAARHAMDVSAARWGRQGPVDLMSYVGAYLSPGHRDRPDRGCALPALAVEAARRGGAVRAAIGEGVEGSAARLAARMAPPAEGRGDAALATLATLVGAVVLARAVEDPALSDRILAAARIAIGEAEARRASGPANARADAGDAP
ncbi:MAG TPA: TetR family transcriptional regulator [Roseomonas sp.]|jgi:TetR/AcrR family transcriptional repressor of nem operon